MGENIKLLILALAVGIIAFFIGSKVSDNRNKAKYRPQMISYQDKIDSMQFMLDTMQAHIDFEYVPKDRVIVQTKYKYIIQKVENEKYKYFALDTSGRVAYFRQRVRARTGK